MRSWTEPSPIRRGECSDCEGVKLDLLAGQGWANDGTIRVRAYRCADCGATTLFGEVPLPPGTSIHALDDEMRARKRRDYRRRHKGTKARRYRESSDRLRVRVSIEKGRIIYSGRGGLTDG